MSWLHWFGVAYVTLLLVAIYKVASTPDENDRWREEHGLDDDDDDDVPKGGSYA